MQNNINNQYIQQEWNRKKNFCHWKLGIMQMIQFPLLNILLLPIIILTVLIWVKMDYAFTAFAVPKIILPIYSVIIKAFGVLIPLLLIWGLIDAIGSLFARKDEARIQRAFEERERRNGDPILMYKRKDKRTGAFIRKWYSPIPLKIWLEQQDGIEHHMEEHLIKELDYDDKAHDNRILMFSKKGRKIVEEDKPVYDKDLEMDMEKYVK